MLGNQLPGDRSCGSSFSAHRDSRKISEYLQQPAEAALIVIMVFLVFVPGTAKADCITIDKAAAQVGSTKCVTGRVLKVTRGEHGTTYLNFCDDYRVCPFQVVVFAGDLRYVGDVRQLAGKTIEISGEVKNYDGRAEIILRQLRQLKGDSAAIPPLPKDFDVEKKGRYSAGKFSYPKSSTRTKRKRKQTEPIQTEDPVSAEE
jgi:hypothetical protein